MSHRFHALAAAALLAALPAVAEAAPQAPARPWASPNLLVSRDRLDEVERRRAAGDPVMVDAVAKAIAEARSRLADTPSPVHGVLKIPPFYRDPQGQQAIVRPLRRDAISAYTFAMAFALSGDAQYADKAKEFVYAWVRSCTHAQDGGKFFWDVLTLSQRGDTPLAIAYTFPQLIYAVDLLKGHGALTPAEVAEFETWLRVFVRYHEREEIQPNNHHSWQAVFLMAAGHILDDRALFDKAVRYYRRGFRVQILGSGAMPLELIRGEKAATYTLMNLEALIQGVHLAEMHGYTDLREMRSYGGGDLRDAVGYLVDFLEDPARWRNGRSLNGPAAPEDWAWVLELPSVWWQDARYTRLLGARPYGAEPPRAYTTSHATLSFAD